MFIKQKHILALLFLLLCNSIYAQVIYEQHIDRLKGGGSGIYNAFTLNYELGFVRLDSVKLIYSNNKKNKQKDLIILYKDIFTIKRQNFLLIVPMKLAVKTKNGTNYYFMSFKRKKLINFVRSFIEFDNQ